MADGKNEIKLVIHKAEASDAPGILAVVKSVHITKLKDLSQGFLMTTELSEEYWRELIQEYPFCYVAKANGETVGFVVAYRFGNDWVKNYDYFLKLLSGRNFIFIEYLAVSSGYRQMGIASQLYQRVISDSGEKLFVACVSKKPVNEASLSFHEKLGFKKVDEHVFDPAYEGFVYALEINK